MTELHEIVGGDEFFTELVERFYAGVAEDPALRPLYPDDLAERDILPEAELRIREYFSMSAEAMRNA